MTEYAPLDLPDDPKLSHNITHFARALRAAGLPVGVHLAAQFGQDELLIALCAELEAAQPWAGKRPDFA